MDNDEVQELVTMWVREPTYDFRMKNPIPRLAKCIEEIHGGFVEK